MSALTSIGLPVALGIIMFGLGLSLTVGDFARVLKQPKAVIVALLCQLILLPVISLTAVNSVIAVVTLPVITNLAILYFNPFDDQLGLQWSKTLEVFAIVLLPVALGMIVRRFWPGFAKGMDKPVRIASVIILVIVIVGAVAQNWALLVENFGRLSLITIVFCLISLTIGYLVPRVIKVGKRQAIASSFEIGIHNATLAIVIAQTVLGSVELSLPAAVYGVLMFFIAFGFGFLIRDRARVAPASEVTAPGSARPS